jgi:hypothetical protein
VNAGVVFMKTKIQIVLVNASILAGSVILAEVLALGGMLMHNRWVLPQTVARWRYWLSVAFEPMDNFSPTLAVILVFAYLSILTASIVFPRLKWLSFVLSGTVVVVWLTALFLHVLAGLIG